MGKEFTMSIDGLKDLEKKLTKNLPAAAQKKVLRSALMFALTPIQKSAKDKVPQKFGDVRKAIRKKSVMKKANNFQATAGIHMATSKGQAGWKWHFIEFGTKAHFVQPLQSTRRNRVVSGEEKKVMSGAGTIYGTKAKIPAIGRSPFLRPAFDENRRAAMRRFKQQLAARIKKEANKK